MTVPRSSVVWPSLPPPAHAWTGRSRSSGCAGCSGPKGTALAKTPALLGGEAQTGGMRDPRMIAALNALQAGQGPHARVVVLAEATYGFSPATGFDDYAGYYNTPYAGSGGYIIPAAAASAGWAIEMRDWTGSGSSLFYCFGDSSGGCGGNTYGSSYFAPAPMHGNSLLGFYPNASFGCCVGSPGVTPGVILADCPHTGLPPYTPAGAGFGLSAGGSDHSVTTWVNGTGGWFGPGWYGVDFRCDVYAPYAARLQGSASATFNTHLVWVTVVIDPHFANGGSYVGPPTPTSTDKGGCCG